MQRILTIFILTLFIFTAFATPAKHKKYSTHKTAHYNKKSAKYAIKSHKKITAKKQLYPTPAEPHSPVNNYRHQRLQ